MTAVNLTVNGEAISAEVTPRTHLADFLREHLLLTGTHIGCEHGICGACTVEIDGEIARSCITYAVACDGAKVRTIEGFDDDRLMARLRRAFSEAHALQCGYCTPGMLIAARDLIRRKGALDPRSDPHRDERQSLSLHRLCRDRERRRARHGGARRIRPRVRGRPAAGPRTGPGPGSLRDRDREGTLSLRRFSAGSARHDEGRRSPIFQGATGNEAPTDQGRGRHPRRGRWGDAAHPKLRARAIPATRSGASWRTPGRLRAASRA